LIDRQEEAQKKVSSYNTTKFYSQKDLIKNDILESKIQIAESKTTQFATTSEISKEKRRKSSSPPPPLNQVKKTSVFRKFSLVNLVFAQESE